MFGFWFTLWGVGYGWMWSLGHAEAVIQPTSEPDGHLTLLFSP